MLDANIVPLPTVPRRFFAAGVFEIPLSMEFMLGREPGQGGWLAPELSCR